MNFVKNDENVNFVKIEICQHVIFFASYLGKVVLNGVGLFRIKNSSNLILVESSTVLSDSVLVVKLSKVGRKD